MPYDYTKYDFDALVEEATRLISDKDTWKDAYQSSTGQVLIQLVAALTDQLHYALERRTQEAYLPTASLITSVRSISNLLGYRAGRRISANGTLSLSLVDSNNLPIQNTDTITIPKYTELTFGDNTFVNTSDITLLSTQTYPYTFNIKEGSVISNTYDPSDITSTLYKDGYILITDYENIEETSFDISTSTQSFTDVAERIGNAPAIESIVFADATDQVYDVRYTNYGLQLVFGDGINGEKPSGLLSVDWLNSSGSGVEVVSTGNTFTFNDYPTELTDDSLNTYKYILTNSTNIDGGQEAETIESIKFRAPTFVRTANRAVTKDDYVYWSKKSGIGTIVDAVAYGEEELGITTINANNVYLTYLTSNGSSLNATQKAELNTYLDSYKPVTTQMVYEAAEIIPIQIQLKLERSTDLTASNSEVYDYIRNQLIDEFAFNEGSLSADRYHSELVDYFHNLTITKEGVDKRIANYVTIDMKALKAFTVPYEVSTDTTITLTYGSDTDVYSLWLDGIQYSYTAGSSDTIDNVGTQLAKYANFHLSANVTNDTGTDTITITQTNIQDVQNLLLWSEDFDNAAWTSTDITVTADSTLSPNGVTNADTLADNNGAAMGELYQTVTIPDDATDWTVSMYVLKATTPSDYPAVKIDLTGGTSVSTTVGFDHENGAASSFAGSTPTINVTDVDDYWRFEITVSNNASGNTSLTYTIYPSYDNVYPLVAADNTLTGSIIAWGAQAENKSAAAKYIRTAEYSQDIAIETDDVENLIIYSSHIDNAAWTKVGTSVVTADSTTSPLGGTDAELLTDDDGASAEYVYQDITIPDSDEPYVFSVFLKQGTATNSTMEIEFNGGTDVHTCIGDIDWTAGTITVGGSSLNVSMSDEGSGWFRFAIECENNLSGNTNAKCSIYPAGTTTTDTGTIYAWGAQLEMATGVGTYVPTYDKQYHLHDQAYSVSTTGSTTPLNNRADITITLPNSILNNVDLDQLFEPSNIELIKENGTIIATDNGAGTIYNGTVSYITGAVTIPVPPDGNYFFRYLQNLDGKFVANEKQAFTYYLSKTNYTDVTETISTITIV